MLAVVFPGQGSQVVGMSADFAERFPESRAVFDEADEALGTPLSDRIANGPEEVLRQTDTAQPAILTASVAVYRALEPRLEVAPAFFAGHSLGEYTALVAAGGLDLSEAVRLVQRRGLLMAESVPAGEGDMVAVLGLSGEDVESICNEIDGVVAPANYNSQLQTVIAGEKSAVRAASEALKAAGAKRVMALAVSAPFHCPLMAPAMSKLEPALGEARFRNMRVPVVSNVTARPYRSADEARRLLRDQVCAPVRWMESVRTLVDEGVKVQLEAGPGNVLTGLAARIEKGLVRARVSEVGDLDAALERVAGALA
jgi:[acyl-carrier-protein] S-malonyltransferase